MFLCSSICLIAFAYFFVSNFEQKICIKLLVLLNFAGSRVDMEKIYIKTCDMPLERLESQDLENIGKMFYRLEKKHPKNC